MSTLVPGKHDMGAGDWQRIGEVVEQKERLGHAPQLNLIARSAGRAVGGRVPSRSRSRGAHPGLQAASLAGECVPEPPEDAAAVLLHSDLGPRFIAEFGQLA